jgi:pimeloyl-ACP methyl ester carboxylesterase
VSEIVNKPDCVNAAHRPVRQQPSLREIRVADATIATWEWEGDGAPILLIHATGLHGRCWDRIVEALPDRRVLALDVRGHGRSSCPPPPYRWSHLARDVIEVVERLALERVVGVGHSMGRHLVTRAAAALPSRFDRLLLLDPAIVPPEILRMIALAGDRIPPVRRRSRFASVSEMVTRLQTRKGFSRWDPRVLDDYCTHGLRPSPNGEGFELACPPEVETAVYVGQADPDIYGLLRSIDLPVHIVRARTHPEGHFVPDFSYSPTWPHLANEFRNASEVHLTEATHFFPMEQPDLVAARIAAYAAGAL